MVFASGARRSPHAKAMIHRLLPQVIVIDGYGSTEMGITGSQAGSGADGPAGSGFRVDATTAVLDDELQPVASGSSTIGRLARAAGCPSATTTTRPRPPQRSSTTGEERWALSGDLATVAADGTIMLLGRGSTTINTGGEKVFAEEVESVLTSSPMVRDAVVVGAPDERWGERVVAVVAPRPGPAPTLAELREHCRPHLAGYKLPKELSDRRDGGARPERQAGLPMGEVARRRRSTGSDRGRTMNVTRLGGLDAAFLAVENPLNPLHVMAIMVLDPSTVPDGFSADRFVATLADRLPRLAPLRRRVVDAPLGLSRPVWSDGETPDLAHHLRRATLDPPGDMVALAAFAASIADVTLDRSRPLWELYVVEGCANGRVAVVAKLHHSLMDGAAGMEFMGALLTLSPDTEPELPDLPTPARPQAWRDRLDHAATTALGCTHSGCCQHAPRSPPGPACCGSPAPEPGRAGARCRSPGRVRPSAAPPPVTGPSPSRPCRGLTWMRYAPRRGRRSTMSCSPAWRVRYGRGSTSMEASPIVDSSPRFPSQRTTQRDPRPRTARRRSRGARYGPRRPGGSTQGDSCRGERGEAHRGGGRYRDAHRMAGRRLGAAGLGGWAALLDLAARKPAPAPLQPARLQRRGPSHGPLPRRRSAPSRFTHSAPCTKVSAST